MVLVALNTPVPDVDLAVSMSHGIAYGRFVLEPTPGLLPPLLARRICSVLAAQLAAAALPSSQTAEWSGLVVQSRGVGDT